MLAMQLGKRSHSDAASPRRSACESRSAGWERQIQRAFCAFAPAIMQRGRPTPRFAQRSQASGAKTTHSSAVARRVESRIRIVSAYRRHARSTRVAPDAAKSTSTSVDAKLVLGAFELPSAPIAMPLALGAPQPSSVELCVDTIVLPGRDICSSCRQHERDGDAKSN